MYPVSIDETSIAPTVAGPTRASIMPAHPDLRAAFQTTLAYKKRDGVPHHRRAPDDSIALDAAQSSVTYSLQASTSVIAACGS